MNEPDSQPDLIKDTRIHLGVLCEATDRELIGAAREFAEWAECFLHSDETSKPVVESSSST